MASIASVDPVSFVRLVFLVYLACRSCLFSLVQRYLIRLKCGLNGLSRFSGLFGLIGAEVFNQTGDDTTGFVRLLIHRIKGRLRHVSLIGSDVEVALNFCSRRYGNKQKLCKFLVGATSKPFCNIGHHRAGGGLSLAGQAQVFLKGPVFCSCIDLPGQDLGLLPALQVFEAGDLQRLSSLSGLFG